MQQHRFGRMPPVSALTLGGGGLGMVWGETTFEECIDGVSSVLIALGIRCHPRPDVVPLIGDGFPAEPLPAKRNRAPCREGGLRNAAFDPAQRVHGLRWPALHFVGR